VGRTDRGCVLRPVGHLCTLSTCSAGLGRRAGASERCGDGFVTREYFHRAFVSFRSCDGRADDNQHLDVDRLSTDRPVTLSTVIQCHRCLGSINETPRARSQLCDGLCDAHYLAFSPQGKTEENNRNRHRCRPKSCPGHCILSLGQTSWSFVPALSRLFFRILALGSGIEAVVG